MTHHTNREENHMTTRVTVFGPGTTGPNESDTLETRSEDDIFVDPETNALIITAIETSKSVAAIRASGPGMVQRVSTYSDGRWDKFVISREVI